MYGLNYTATISRPTISNVNGQDKKIYTTIYTGIPCAYYELKGTLSNTNIASQTEKNRFKVILESDKIVYRGNKISIDSTDYIIEDIKNQKLMGNINHISLIVKQL